MRRSKKVIEEPVEKLEINEPEVQEAPEIEPVSEIEEPELQDTPTVEQPELRSVIPAEPVKPVEQTIRWKKVGGSTFILNNRMIKPGQVFHAKVSEIPKAFRDLIIPVDELPVEVDELSLLTGDASYNLKQNGDKWDILNRQGKKMNEVALSRDEALMLIKQLL